MTKEWTRTACDFTGDAYISDKPTRQSTVKKTLVAHGLATAGWRNQNQAVAMEMVDSIGDAGLEVVFS
jgi:hypothetical protein